MDTHPERRPAAPQIWKGKLPAAVAVTVIIATVLALAYYAYTYSNTRAVGSEVRAATRMAFESITPLSSDEIEELRKYRNEEHVETAESLGFPGLAVRDDVLRLARRDSLVQLEESARYGLEPMEHSMPFVTDDAQALLDTLGARFHQALKSAGLPLYRFRITSATRPREDQESLQKVNSNAAQKSSHEYGTTVDIHYDRFEYVAASDSLPRGFGIDRGMLEKMIETEADRLAEAQPEVLKALLGKTLQELQDEGKVLVIHERLQPVFHITVAAEIAEDSSFARFGELAQEEAR